MSNTLYANMLNIKEQEQLNIIKLAFDQITDWIVITDITGTILYINPAVEAVSGYSNIELLGNKPSAFQSELVPREVYTELWETILAGKIYSNIVTNRHKSGTLYYIASVITPIKDETGEIKYFISTGREMSDESEINSQIHNVIHYDALTGLLNRKSFVEEICKSKENCKNIAVVAVTINKLGLINSRFGFLWGDKVIREIGLRIKNFLDGDCLVSRPEGKVFAILYPDFGNPHKIVQFITKLEEVLKEPILIKAEQIYLSVSFGISTHPSDKVSEIHVKADALLTRAQLALSKAKKSNRLENYEFYTFSMNQQANDQIQKENEIYQAFKNDEFISYFQPFINLETGRVSGAEALMRRKKATGEIVSPIEFIGILEETGLIIEVGFNLIDKICQQIRSWIDQYGLDLPVSINLSPVQFKDELFCQKMMAIVEKYRIPSRLINFEITESILIEDTNRTICLLERLRENGFSVSIDDFGTGYSSLSYIQRFKINRIKIDMSFITNIVTNEADQAIVKAIIMMAEGLNLETLAEGVETADQLAILRDLGADIGQGYYWDKPLSAEEVTLKYFGK